MVVIIFRTPDRQVSIVGNVGHLTAWTCQQVHDQVPINYGSGAQIERLDLGPGCVPGKARTLPGRAGTALHFGQLTDYDLDAFGTF